MPARVRKLQLKTDMDRSYLSTTSRAFWLRAKCILRALTGEVKLGTVRRYSDSNTCAREALSFS